MLSFKCLRLLFFLISLSLILVGSGCNKTPSGGQSRDTTCSNCSNLKNRISVLEQEKAQMSSERDNAIVERDNAISERDNAIVERDKAITAQKIAEKKAYDRYIVLSVISYIALAIGILLVSSFLLMILNARKNAPKVVNDNLHCPRCGWEHAAGETTCKKCKTHF